MADAVTESTFEHEVLQADKPVLVDFWAEWCGPCHAVAPILDRIVEERDGELKLVKVNIDEEQEIAERYGIASIPTMVLFKDGEPAAAAIGAQPKGALEAQLGPVARRDERLFELGLGFFLLRLRQRRDRPARRLVHELQHAHAVREDDRAAEPAPGREQDVADERQDERSTADRAVGVVGVPGSGGDREHDRRRRASRSGGCVAVRQSGVPPSM